MRHQLLTALLLAAGAANASNRSGFGLDVLVSGDQRPEFVARGTTYVEALKGRDYSLRLSNPTGRRVAVALSVDGLNTIDAKHTSARDARKWVLAPYETVVIPGWQVNSAVSRKFVFTGERGSYGAMLGKTEDLGIIEAVFYREKLPYRSGWIEKDRRNKEEISSNERGQGERRPDAPASGTLQGAAQEPAPSEAAARDHSQKSSSSSFSSPPPSSSMDSSAGAKLSDEYAATGMGNRTRFGVEQIEVDLESEPAAVVRLRYEFRPQLVSLGVLPSDPDPARIARRERARGFDEFCPEAR